MDITKVKGYERRYIVNFTPTEHNLFKEWAKAKGHTILRLIHNCLMNPSELVN